MKKLIYIIIALLVLTSAIAINCDYDTEPFLQKEIKWECQLNYTNQRCYSYVMFNNSLLSVSPEEQFIQDVGRIDYFESKGKLVNVYFSNKDLYPYKNYTFAVKCASVTTDNIELFSTTVYPVQKEAFEVSYRAVWIKDNVGYIIGSFLFILILLIVIGYIWSLRK